MPPNPSWRSVIGIAKEVTKGSVVTPPTDFIRVTKFDATPVANQLYDRGWRGSPVEAYGSQHGKRWYDLAISGNVHVDSFGHWLKQLLPEEATSGTAPTTHTFTMITNAAGQNSGLTVYDDDKLQADQYAAFTPWSVTLNYSPDGLLTYDIDASAHWPEAHAAITPSWTSVTPLPAWTATAKVLNASNNNAVLTKATIKLSRAKHIILGSAGAQNPSNLWQGIYTVSIDATVVIDTADLRAAMNANTQSRFELKFDRGVGAAQEQLMVGCTTPEMTTLVKERGNGDGFMEAKVTFTALGNTTDVGASAGYGPAIVTLLNQRTTAY